MPQPTNTSSIKADLAAQIKGWRLLGAAIWHCTASCIALYIYTLIRSPTLWLLPWKACLFSTRPITIACLAGATAPLAAATLSLHWALHVHEPQPSYTLRFAARLPVPLGVSVGAARLVGRLSSATAVTTAALLVLLHALSGVLFVLFDMRLSRGWFVGGAGMLWWSWV